MPNSHSTPFAGRRRFLQWCAAGILGGLAGSASNDRARADVSPLSAEATSVWGYIGESTPENWGELREEFYLCGGGLRQSPIDLSEAIASEAIELELDYHPMPLRLADRRTFRIDCAPGSGLSLDDDRRFELLQFHFHCPSEHWIGGAAEAIECHFVHREAETGELLVLAAFLRAEAGGTENAAIAAIQARDREPSSDIDESANRTIDPRALLPARLDRLYRYDGSLTTPPCSESVRWLIYADPVAIPPRQADWLTGAIAPNARPLQPRNQRPIFGSV